MSGSAALAKLTAAPIHADAGCACAHALYFARPEIRDLVPVVERFAMGYDTISPPRYLQKEIASRLSKINYVLLVLQRIERAHSLRDIDLATD